MSNLCRVVESNFKFVPVMKGCTPIAYNAETLDRFGTLEEQLTSIEDYVNIGRAKEQSGRNYMRQESFMQFIMEMWRMISRWR